MAISFEISPPGRREEGRSFRIVLEMDKILIGRGAPCDVRIPDQRVSYHHATIETLGSNCFITDNGSKNGTFLAQRRLQAGVRYRLDDGDVVTICGYNIVVRLGVTMTEPYSAEKTDQLARQVLSFKEFGSGSRSRCWMVVGEGPGAGWRFDLPADRDLFTVGTAEGCDVVVRDAKVKDIRIEVELTPAGWRVKPQAVAALPPSVSLPPNGRLRNGSVIKIGKVQLRFYDEIDEALTILKTLKDTETKMDTESPKVPVPIPPDERPLVHPQTPHKLLPASARQSPASRVGLRAAGRQVEPGESEENAVRYRIAALAFGIFAFLVSLLFLIVVLF